MALNDVKEIQIPVNNSIAGYTKIEYIQSTGTQYFDTNFYPKPTTCVELDFQFTETTVQQRLFGVTGNFVFQSYINGAGNWAYSYQDTSGNWVNTGVAADTNRHKLAVDGKNKLWILDGQNGKTLSGTPANTANKKLWIFRRNEAGDLIGKFKLYNCKIYDNGTLIRNYIPVIRNSDNVPGVYDLVNNTFTTSSDGTFVAGNALTDIKVDKITDPNNNIIWGSQTAFLYRRLEYIHFAGVNEYINPYIIQKSGFYRYVQFDLERNDVRQMIMAVYDQSNGRVDNLRRYYACDFQPNTYGARGACGNTWSNNYNITNVPLNTKLRIAAVNSTVSSKPRMAFNLKNLVTNTDLISTTTLTGGTNGSLPDTAAYLMANHNKSDTQDIAEHFAKGKVYYFCEKNGTYQGTYTHQMFPVQRKSDGKCGLFDVILKEFHPMYGTTTTDDAAGPILDEYWDLNTPSDWVEQ